MRQSSSTSSSPPTGSMRVVARPVGVEALDQAVVGVGHRRHLGQVGDHDHLAALGERAQPGADGAPR